VACQNVGRLLHVTVDMLIRKKNRRHTATGVSSVVTFHLHPCHVSQRIKIHIRLAGAVLIKRHRNIEPALLMVIVITLHRVLCTVS
jgi:hypothetical protein